MTENFITHFKNRPGLRLLLIGFVIAASLYSILTPPFEMSDELWHYPMVKTLADGNGLPIQNPANPGPWKQEGSQPPLYYYLGAAATFWIDTSDIDQVLRPNPHVDNGIITQDGNNNLIAHNFERENSTWRGTILAVHIIRFLSVIMSTGAVYFAYRIGEEVFPKQSWLALSSAAAVAFTPMFAFISGAVNNDNLAILLATAGLWIMMRIAKEADADHPTLRLAIILGLVLGLAAMTKTSVLGQFGLAGLTIAYAAWRVKRWQTFFIEGPLIIGLAAAVGGWWYWRNFQLYGDPLGLNIFIAILGQRARPASLLQLWGERFGFMQSYWGLFGGVNLPMPGWIYTTLNTLAIISVGGTFTYLFLKFKRDRTDLKKWTATLLTLLWIAGVVVPLVSSWARITWSSQGRLVFSAISAINLWFIAGLSAWLPERWGKISAGTILAFMASLTFIAPFAWITPNYQLPEQLPTLPDEEVVDFTPPGADAPAMRLLGYEVDTTQVEVGGTVELTLYWESLKPMERNWSTFIHLTDRAGFIAGQRDTYPGLGLISTSEIEPGYQWADHYVIPVNPSAYAPEDLLIKVGLYDYASCPACQRMGADTGEDTLTIGAISLSPRPSDEDIPNPVRFNYGDQMLLTGYAVDIREAQAGKAITLSLFWEGLVTMENNYTISAQILGDDEQRVAQKDSWPLDGALPTAAWTPGETIEDSVTLTLSEETPPGEYTIQVVVYWVDENGELQRLPLITADGRLVDDFLLLTKIRVIE